jgi:hypothetical protein
MYCSSSRRDGIALREAARGVDEGMSIESLNAECVVGLDRYETCLAHVRTYLEASQHPAIDLPRLKYMVAFTLSMMASLADSCVMSYGFVSMQGDASFSVAIDSRNGLMPRRGDDAPRTSPAAETVDMTTQRPEGIVLT